MVTVHSAQVNELPHLIIIYLSAFHKNVSNLFVWCNITCGFMYLSFCPVRMYTFARSDLPCVVIMTNLCGFILLRNPENRQIFNNTDTRIAWLNLIVIKY